MGAEAQRRAIAAGMRAGDDLVSERPFYQRGIF